MSHFVKTHDPETPAAPCRLLYAAREQAAERQGRSRHRHAFWQVELFLAGNAYVLGKTEEHATQAGDVWLIPPSTLHGFIYPEAGTTWVSAKFTCPMAFPPRLIRMDNTHARRALGDGLRVMVTDDAEMTPPVRLAMEGIIEGMVLAARPAPRIQAPDTVADQVAARVRAQSDQYITVTQLAEELGYSPGYLSSIFHKQQGEPLKSYLDRIRGEAAARHLHYADLSITQIAARMGFPDIYSFSRFCKRVLGNSPKQLRLRRPPSP